MTRGFKSTEFWIVVVALAIVWAAVWLSTLEPESATNATLVLVPTYVGGRSAVKLVTDRLSATINKEND